MHNGIPCLVIFVLYLSLTLDMSSNVPNNCSVGLFHCKECKFVSGSQGGLGVHRVKKHKASDCDNIHSVSVICEYPKGKPFYCCICDTIIKSRPNFTRHFRAIHPNTPLLLLHCAHCVIDSSRILKELVYT